MKELLAYYKETDNKCRWDALVDDTPFELYIPKWRIPYPVPGKVLIRIFTNKKNVPFSKTYTPDDVLENPDVRKEPIFAEVEFTREHTKTFRYDPIGDNRKWEIGSPYIPKSVLESEKIEKLYLNVEWE